MKIFRISRILTFGLGAAAGYYLGNREGREQARQAMEQAKQTAQQFWQDPKTQEQVHKATGYATDTIKAKAPKLAGASEKAADLIDKSTGYEPDSQDQTGSSKADPANDKAGHQKTHVNGDVISDPSQSLEEEGGTTGSRGNE